MYDWIKIPTEWITRDDSILKELKWKGKYKHHNTAALMIYMAIAHHINYENTPDRGGEGQVIFSYPRLSEIVTMSRASIAGGLKVLEKCELISRERVNNINCYTLIGFLDISKFGKLPAKKLYDDKGTSIKAFKNFHLRSKVELHALKLYFLIVAFRQNRYNRTNISYDKITEYIGIDRRSIRSAISLLVANELVHIDKKKTKSEEYSYNSYRLIGIDPNIHGGTVEEDEYAENSDADVIDLDTDEIDLDLF